MNMKTFQISDQDNRYLESNEDASELAGQTLLRLKEHDLPPNPINFTLIYETLIKIDPEFAQRILEALDNKNYDNESAIIFFTELWSKLIRKQLPTEEVTLILNEMMAITNNWLTSSTSNLEKLSQYITKISLEKDCDTVLQCLREQIIPIIESLLQETELLKTNIRDVSREVTHLKLELDKATSIAITDELTNIPNRRGFNQFVKKQIEAANAEAMSFAMILVDIDHFKHVNDHYGHLVGDSILRYLAKALTNEIKGKDFVARIGGEEFVIILPATFYSDALKVSEHIRDKIAQNPLQVRGKDKRLKLTVSIGVAIYQLGEPLEDLFDRADKSLYLAKNSGRNKVCGESDL